MVTVELGPPCKSAGRWGFWIHAPGGSRFYHRNWRNRAEAEAGRAEYERGLIEAGERVATIYRAAIHKATKPKESEQ